MNLYTSYWAQVRNFPKNLIGLNTTVWPPKWRPLGQDKRGIWVIDCPPLKPGIECSGLCNGTCAPKHPNDCKFLKTYEKQLDKIDLNLFLQKLNNLSAQFKEGENLVEVNFAFIVFEAVSNPCSERKIIQNWLLKNNIPIKEWSHEL